MRGLALALLLGSIVSPARASEGRFSLSLRAGYALPFGDVGQGLALSDVTSGAIPLWVDAGYQINPSIYGGAYFQYAPAFAKGCDPGATCSAADYRAGVNFLYFFLPNSLIDPWVGLGVGYEWFNENESIGGGSASQNATVSGWEFVNVQAGADFAISQAFSVGPYAVFSLSQYGTGSLSIAGQSASGSIPSSDRTLHEWVQLGVKGTFRL